MSVTEESIVVADDHYFTIALDTFTIRLRY